MSLTMDGAEELLAQFCADLRLLRTQAGGPSLRLLSERVGMSKSQLGVILNGQVQELPDWRVVTGLVESFVECAQEQGRTARLSLPTGVEEFWRHRYAMVEHAFGQETYRRTGSAPPSPNRHGSARVPRQLPAAVRYFVGRDNELAALTALLDGLDGGGGAVGMAVISAIGGTAGVGKTALAVHWAHQVADRFPDGQLYLNLRGFDPGGSPMNPSEALRALLDAFAVPHERIPDNVDARAGLYRSLLAGKRVLVVLDNARDAEHVRPLLPATSGCLAVITSRDRLTGLLATDGAYPVSVDLLTHEEAHDMLSQRLGGKRVVAESQAVEEIINHCARLPLALAIAAALAAAHSDRPLAVLATELRQARESLDAFASGDPVADVRTVFSWSYDTLSQDAARLFRLLALAPGAEISATAAASLAGLPRRRTHTVLAELTRSRLLTENAHGRYSLHDLLRAYAIEQAREHDPGEERQAAIHRVLDHYRHTAYEADRRLSPTRDPIAVAPAGPGVHPEAIADEEQARAWFSAERPVLLAAVDQSARYNLHTCTWQLVWALNTFLSRQGLWRECVAAEELALEAARRIADRDAQGLATRAIGRAFTRLGRYDEAHRYLDDSVAIYSELGDDVGQAHDQLNIGEVYLRQGRPSDALRHAERALALYRSAGYLAGQANALNNTGWLYAQLGNHEQALRRCEQALVLHQRTGDGQGEATTWDSLGYTHHVRGEYDEAVACYQRALDLYRRLGDRYYEALALASLGDTYHITAGQEAAAELWQSALAILAELDHPDTADVLARLHRPASGKGPYPGVPDNSLTGC
jgi:tetratricopeptide (TPR) repeat protein